MSDTENTEIAIFGGGCFWCTEAVFLRLKGVKKVTSGYSGGSVENPTYGEVCNEKTGHAEVIKIEFDPKVIKFTQLIEVFFAVHDPRIMNRQGPDTGSQYRSIILYTSDTQRSQAEKEIAVEQKKYKDPIVTELVPFSKFYTAEQYHQNYFEKNPGDFYCNVNASPKIDKIKNLYPELFRT